MKETNKKGSGGGTPEAPKDITRPDQYSTLAKVFKSIADRPLFAPYILVWNPKREKYDKIPIDGISTARPEQWMPYSDAVALAQQRNAPGVGLLFNGFIERDSRVLVGLDFDDVDFKVWKPPFKGYAEKSPSGNGVHMYAWVPRTWAELHRDTGRFDYPGCDHGEYYQGTSPRFLTLTGDVIHDSLI